MSALVLAPIYSVFPAIYPAMPHPGMPTWPMGYPMPFLPLEVAIPLHREAMAAQFYPMPVQQHPSWCGPIYHGHSPLSPVQSLYTSPPPPIIRSETTPTQRRLPIFVKIHRKGIQEIQMAENMRTAQQ